MLAPELLVDVLGRILARRGVKVVRLPLEEGSPEEGPDEPQAGVDVAVVAREAPPERVPADVVVVLPEGGLHAWRARTEVAVTDQHGRTTVEVADVEALVELIVKLTADC